MSSTYQLEYLNEVCLHKKKFCEELMIPDFPKHFSPYGETSRNYKLIIIQFNCLFLFLVLIGTDSDFIKFACFSLYVYDFHINFCVVHYLTTISKGEYLYSFYMSIMLLFYIVQVITLTILHIFQR